MGIKYIRHHDKQLFVSLPFTAFDSSGTKLILLQKDDGSDNVHVYTTNEIISYFSKDTDVSIFTEEEIRHYGITPWKYHKHYIQTNSVKFSEYNVWDYEINHIRFKQALWHNQTFYLWTPLLTA